MSTAPTACPRRPRSTSTRTRRAPRRPPSSPTCTSTTPARACTIRWSSPSPASTRPATRSRSTRLSSTTTWISPAATRPTAWSSRSLTRIVTSLRAPLATCQRRSLRTRSRCSASLRCPSTTSSAPRLTRSYTARTSTPRLSQKPTLSGCSLVLRVNRLSPRSSRFVPSPSQWCRTRTASLPTSSSRSRRACRRPRSPRCWATSSTPCGRNRSTLPATRRCTMRTSSTARSSTSMAKRARARRAARPRTARVPLARRLARSRRSCSQRSHPRRPCRTRRSRLRAPSARPRVCACTPTRRVSPQCSARQLRSPHPPTRWPSPRAARCSQTRTRTRRLRRTASRAASTAALARSSFTPASTRVPASMTRRLAWRAAWRRAR
mmetsp:Transcript_27513/g.55374  ORF Transcript_27513/g.55374 Transcript_27513/m.55374 type:complete len:379 (+) Transcript_27513:234-1370(+)